MERLKWILIAGGPVWLMVIGGLIMYAGGYRGYGMDQNVLQYFGAGIAFAGGLWFVVIMVIKIVKWFIW